METLYLPTILPFLTLNYMGQPRRPRTGNRVIFSLHDNGTDMNGVTEQPPSLVAGSTDCDPFPSLRIPGLRSWPLWARMAWTAFLPGWGTSAGGEALIHSYSY